MLSVWGSKSRRRRILQDRRGRDRHGCGAAEAFVETLAASEVLDAAGRERALAALDRPGRRPLPVLLTELGLIHEAGRSPPR